MRKHLIGTFRTRAFRLRAWKILNAVVAVATVANISLVGVLLPKAALAAPASIWTTRTTCVNPDPQDENEYFAGDTVYIRGSNFLANTQYYWTINGQPGSADPGDPSDPSDSPIANGTVTTDVDGYFCLGAYVIGSDGDTDAGVYTVDVSETADMKQSKNDNYHVDGGMLTVHKLADTDGNGSFEVTVDSEGGFAWKIVGTSDWRFFGTSVELAPDDYQVEENDINGYHMVGWTYGSPEQFDGNICEDGELSDAATAPVEIGNNETTHVTFCNQVDMGISGTKYYDWNRNGQANAGDQPLANWEINLYRIADGWIHIGTAYTNGSGNYGFTNLVYDDYVVCENVPSGWAPTDSGFWSEAGWCKETSVNQVVDFHNYLTGVIHGQKFNDLNGNGLRDCSFPDFGATSALLAEIGPVCEPSLNGWTIFIDANDNGALDLGELSMQTQFHDGPYFDDNGWYWFEDLQPGTHKVCEVQQSGWGQTYPINANGNCHTITLPRGGEGDTCFNPQTLQLDVVENAVVGPTCNFGNKFVPVTTINLVKDGPATVNAGDNITYTLNWSIGGNTAATNAIITDPIPANTTFVSADNGGTMSAGVVTWNLGTKNPGENGTVSLTVKSASPVTDGTLVTNTGTFDTDQTDPKLDDANTVLHFTPPPTPQVLGATTEPNLTITKAVNKDTAKPGDILTYTITVTSTGTGDAENVIVTDTLPDDFSFAEGSGKTRTWDLGTLAPGQSSIINVDVRVESDAVRGDYINVATVDADGVDQKQASVTVAVSTPQVLGLATTGSSALDYFVFALGSFLAAFGLVGLKLRRTTPIRVRK